MNRIFHSKGFLSRPLSITDEGLVIYFGNSFKTGNLTIEKENIRKLWLTTHCLCQSPYSLHAKLHIRTVNPSRELKIYGIWGLSDNLLDLFSCLHDQFGEHAEITRMTEVKETIREYEKQKRGTHVYLIFLLICLISLIIYVKTFLVP